MTEAQNNTNETLTEELKNTNETPQPEATTNDDGQTDELTALRARVAQLEKEAADYKDQWLRSAADADDDVEVELDVLGGPEAEGLEHGRGVGLLHERLLGMGNGGIVSVDL